MRETASILVLTETSDRWFGTPEILGELLRIEGINDVDAAPLETSVVDCTGAVAAHPIASQYLTPNKWGVERRGEELAAECCDAAPLEVSLVCILTTLPRPSSFSGCHRPILFIVAILASKPRTAVR